MNRVLGIGTRLVLFAVVMAGPAYVLLVNFAVVEPYLYPLHWIQGNVRRVAPDIIVGPYPEFRLLVSLRARGVKIVVSLLDPHLIYETSLIKQEKRYSKTLGMKDYDFPMDSRQPSSSPLNARALRKIRELVARHPHTKVYIHCYLGIHRVGDVVAMLRRHDEAPAATVGSVQPRASKHGGETVLPARGR